MPGCILGILTLFIFFFISILVSILRVAFGVKQSLNRMKNGPAPGSAMPSNRPGRTTPSDLTTNAPRRTHATTKAASSKKTKASTWTSKR